MSTPLSKVTIVMPTSFVYLLQEKVEALPLHSIEIEEWVSDEGESDEPVEVD